jgi:hypothetical protein
MFKSPLILEADKRPGLWVVREPLTWVGVGGRITVPVGTVTDLASIPTLVQNIPFLDPTGRSRRPAVLHDYLYNQRGPLGITRALADKILRAALRAEGCSRTVAWTFWAGVRLGGWASWRDHA